MGKKCVQAVNTVRTTLGITTTYAQALVSAFMYLCTKAGLPLFSQQLVHSRQASGLICPDGFSTQLPQSLLLPLYGYNKTRIKPIVRRTV